jgi:hypothetical protein
MEENKHPVLTALNDKISELLTKIAELEKEIEDRKEQSRQRANSFVADIQKLEEVLVEGIKDSEITQEFAESIADIFGVELTEEIAVEFTFKVQASFTVPIGFDSDELANEVGISTEFVGDARDFLNNDFWELTDWEVSS